MIVFSADSKAYCRHAREQVKTITIYYGQIASILYFGVLQTAATTDSFLEKGTIAGCIALGMSQEQAIKNAKKASAIKKKALNQGKKVLKKLKKD